MSDETSPLLPHDGPAENAPSEASDNPSESINREPPPKSTLELVTILAPLGIGLLLVALDGTLVLSSFAAIGSDFNELQETSWIATGYLLTMTSFLPLYGKLCDIFGRKPCLLFAYMIFSLGCLFCGLAQSMTQLIAARAFAGVGGGGMTTVTIVILSDVVPLRSRGTWQGIANVVFSVGSVIGAPLGGILADTIGWRWSFLFQVPAMAIAIPTVALTLNLPQQDKSDFWTKLKRVDVGGALALVVAIFSLVFGLDRAGNVSWRDQWTITALLASAVSSTTFMVIEAKHAKEPFAPRRIVLQKTLSVSYLVTFFVRAAAMITIFYVSLYLQAVLGATVADAGLMLLPSIAGSVVGCLGAGLVMQATGKYYWLTLGSFAIFLAGTVWVVLASGVITRSLVGIALGLVASNFGSGIGITTSLIAVIANAGPQDQAMATAVVNLFGSLGSVLGLSAGSSILQGTLRNYLQKQLSGQNVDEIILRVRESLDYINQLELPVQAIVRSSYEQSVQITLWFAVGLAIITTFLSTFIQEKSLVKAK